MNALKTTILLGAMTGLLLAMGGLLGGRDGMALALILAGVMNFGAWF
jgi:heat shock protein HtpX